MEESFAEFGAIKKDFDTLKEELIDFIMTKEQVKQMSQLIQLVNSQKVQQAEEMEDLKLANAVQIRELRKENNFSADCFPTKKDQTLSDTDPVQFVSHKRDIVRPLCDAQVQHLGDERQPGEIQGFMSNEQHICSKVYPLNRKTVNSNCKKLLRRRAVVKGSSYYASPVTIVKKLKGSPRVCVKKINKGFQC